MKVCIDFTDGHYSFDPSDWETAVDVPDEVVALWDQIYRLYMVVQRQCSRIDNATWTSRSRDRDTDDESACPSYSVDHRDPAATRKFCEGMREELLAEIRKLNGET